MIVLTGTQISRPIVSPSRRVLVGVLGAFLAGTAEAQTHPPVNIPNAGDIIQQRNAAGLTGIDRGADQEDELIARSDGGRRFFIKKIEFSGNKLLSQQELETLMQGYIGQNLSERDIDGIAEKINAAYRQQGYGFVFASLNYFDPQEALAKFSIVEGKAEEIQIQNCTRVRGALLEGMMSRFRAHPENTDELERASLLMSDIPGVAVARPNIFRGRVDGTVNVAMDVQPARVVNGYASLDNYGSRISGRTRLSAIFGVDNPFGWGDAFRANVSGFPLNQNGDSTLGGFSYDFPIGNFGLRGGLGFNRLQYHLGGIYSDQFDGTANTWSAYASYPIIRQKNLNLVARLTYSHGIYNDNQVGFENKRSSDGVSALLLSSVQDAAFGKAAINRFSITFTHGAMRYDNPLFAMQDATGSQTAGGYSKLEWTLSRFQQITGTVSFRADVLGQYAFKNLDGSARMVLGGPSAVRAYSSDFVSADSGILMKAEANWRAPISLPLSASVFYDHATGILRHTPFAGQTNNVNLQGAGIGLSLSYGAVSASLSLATRVGGRAPGIEEQPKSWAWLSLTYAWR
ncbi:ShlB/FhaC/HecB family hemolysin secretion/activation protein [Burkholderia orbicola]|uniref:ShlB/FhaC/HecB family hemolysin secretion/activation protein n=1 Tax=Burkholderia orbicola TaxID=2978683 RepID=UPI002FE2C561